MRPLRSEHLAARTGWQPRARRQARPSDLAGRDDMNTYVIRKAPEPGYRWFVRDTESGAVLGWFDHQVAHWFADEQHRAGRQVEIGCSRHSPRQTLTHQPQRQPRSEPEAEA